MLKTLSLLGLTTLLATASADYNVLVFGDSQGDTGPTYEMLQDVLDQVRPSVIEPQEKQLKTPKKQRNATNPPLTQCHISVSVHHHRTTSQPKS